MLINILVKHFYFPIFNDTISHREENCPNLINKLDTVYEIRIENAVIIGKKIGKRQSKMNTLVNISKKKHNISPDPLLKVLNIY